MTKNKVKENFVTQLVKKFSAFTEATRVLNLTG